jgi:hypothetical protein
MKDFYDEWRALIHSFISGGTVVIEVNDDVGKKKVNDNVGNHFQTKKGLRQGDPLSPMPLSVRHPRRCGERLWRAVMQ